MIRRFFLLFSMSLVVGNGSLQARIYNFFPELPTGQIVFTTGIAALGGYALNSWATTVYYNRYIAPGTTTNAISDKPVPKVPIVYSPEYNITLGGFERLHPFDTQKYGKIYAYLMKHFGLTPESFYTPSMVSDQQLLKAHTKKYLDSLLTSSTIAKITEIPMVALIPNILVQKYVLRSMRYATGGTILGAELALQHGWAINLGGGYHHAKNNEGGGFCVYADAPLALALLHEKNPNLKAMIIDLDAHQGNGNAIALKDEILDERGEFKTNARVALFDMYNKDVWPVGNTDFIPVIGNLFMRMEAEAIKPVKYNHPLPSGTTDADYLRILKDTLPQALDEFKPQLIIYNAGTDILAGDSVGRLKVSSQGIIERDQYVFEQARKRNIPILMILSGGYTLESATIVSESIANLKTKGLITW